MSKGKIETILLKGSIVDDFILGASPISIDEYMSDEEQPESFDPGMYGQNLHFDIVVDAEDFSEEVSVGFIQGRFFDLRQMDDDGLEHEWIMDDIDQYTWDLYEAVMDNDEAIGIMKNLFIIDRLCIDKEWQGQQIGSVAILILEEMIKHQFGRSIGAFLVEPNVLASKGEEIDTAKAKALYQKIVCFWERLSFKSVSEDSDIMYFNTDLDMKEEYRKNVD